MQATQFLFQSATVLFVAASPQIGRADTFGSGDNGFEIEFVTIGDPGNPPDTVGFRFGSVDYVYDLAKFEVSRDMITKANAEGNLGLTLDPLATPVPVNGGTRPDMPATGMSWNEAARFVNWLNSSKGYSPAYKFSTQPVTAGYDANENVLRWEAGEVGFDADNEFRNRLARYVLPGTDEWYKAAFYDPGANGGAGGYWNYPTGSNSSPTAVASGTAMGTAVWDHGLRQGPADVTHAGGLSPYGVMGLAGNALEWHETVSANPIAGSSDRNLQGGSYDSESDFGFQLDRSTLGWAAPTADLYDFGFRVASVPEPSSQLLGLLAVFGLLLRSRAPRRSIAVRAMAATVLVVGTTNEGYSQGTYEFHGEGPSGSHRMARMGVTDMTMESPDSIASFTLLDPGSAAYEQEFVPMDFGFGGSIFEDSNGELECPCSFELIPIGSYGFQALLGSLTEATPARLQPKE